MAQNGLAVGMKEPNFTVKDQNRKTIKLSEDLQKAQVLIVFYRGHWCLNCTREPSSIEDSLHLLKEKNITVIGVGPEANPGVKKTIEKTKDTNWYLDGCITVVILSSPVHLKKMIHSGLYYCIVSE